VAERRTDLGGMKGDGTWDLGVVVDSCVVAVFFLVDGTGSNHAWERRESDSKKTYLAIYHGLGFAAPRTKVRPPSSPTTRSFAVGSGAYPADGGGVSVVPIAAPETHQIKVRRRHLDDRSIHKTRKQLSREEPLFRSNLSCSSDSDR
jgi:hypothetical protein